MTYLEIFLLLEGVKNKTLHLCLTESHTAVDTIYHVYIFQRMEIVRPPWWNDGIAR